MELSFRRATRADLPQIVALIADDQLGALRDDPSPPLAREYEEAFATIDADPAQLLVVDELTGGELVATAQLTVIPGLARRGAARMQIEAVRVASAHRGRGIGGALMRWCIDHARERGCALVQLASDARRTDAHDFYGSLGFEPSHIGFKLKLRR